MISYAQNAEDVVLARTLHDVSSGFYIDVGANDPIQHSVTKHFYDAGWHGINVEPVPHLHAALSSARPRDINLLSGLLHEPGTLDFYEVQEIHGWSTFSAELAHHYESLGHKIVKRQIPVRTLKDICQQYVKETIQFLKIDVEGMEKLVLLGADFTHFRPRIVLLEVAGDSFKEWEPTLLDAHYHFVLFDGVNRFYVREEDLQLLQPRILAPANCVDDFMPHRYYLQREELATALAEKSELAQSLQAQVQQLHGTTNAQLAELLPLREISQTYHQLSPTGVKFLLWAHGFSQRHPKLKAFVNCFRPGKK